MPPQDTGRAMAPQQPRNPLAMLEPQDASVRSPEAAAMALERVVSTGDLMGLTPAERVNHYLNQCESLGLNPHSRPFDWLILNSRMILYPNATCAAQLRSQHRIAIRISDRRVVEGDLYSVTAAARLPDGREDESTAYVSVKGLNGEALANAYMKCETKAKRRVTFSVIGMAGPAVQDAEEMRGARQVIITDQGDMIDSPTEEEWAIDGSPSLQRVLSRSSRSDVELPGPPDAPCADLYWRPKIMAAGRAINFGDPEQRAAFLGEHTKDRADGPIHSLKDFLQRSTNTQALNLLVALQNAQRPKRSYEDLFEHDPDMATPPTPAPRAAMTRESIPAEVHAAAVLTGAPMSPSTSPELPRPEEGRTYSRAQWEAMYAVWSARLSQLDVMKKPVDVATLKGAALPQTVLQIIKEADDLEAYFATFPADEEPDDADEDGEHGTVSAF
jgi:hypothetical protein